MSQVQTDTHPHWGKSVLGELRSSSEDCCKVGLTSCALIMSELCINAAPCWLTMRHSV